MTAPLPRVICEPQTQPWTCTLAVWEYLTGVPRSEIEESLQHDGGTTWTNEVPPPLNRTGVFPSEIVWWAHSTQNLQIVHLTAREYFKHFKHAKAHAVIMPSSDQVFEEAQGRLAGLTVKMLGSPNTGHEVAWFGDFYIDPFDGLPQRLEKSDLLAAIVILEGVSLNDRKNALLAETNSKRAFASVATNWWLSNANIEDDQRERLSAHLWLAIARQVCIGKEIMLAVQGEDSVLRAVCESVGIHDCARQFRVDCVMKVTSASVEVLEPENQWRSLWRADSQ